MEINSFRNLMNEFESILKTFVGMDDEEDLSPRIHIKLSPAYEKILFEANETFRVDIFKERLGYFIDIIHEKKYSNKNTIAKEYFLKVVDGKIVELS